MTEEELLQEFLEATGLEKQDVKSHQCFKQIDYNGITYKCYGLIITLKMCSDKLTYFHHPALSTLNNVRSIYD